MTDFSFHPSVVPRRKRNKEIFFGILFLGDLIRDFLRRDLSPMVGSGQCHV